METEPVQLVQTIIYKSNTYRQDLSWLHFNDDPRVPEKQQVKYPTHSFLQLIWHVHVAAGSTSLDMITIFHVSSYGIFIEIKNNFTRKELRKSNEGSNFLGGSLVIETM